MLSIKQSLIPLGTGLLGVFGGPLAPDGHLAGTVLLLQSEWTAIPWRIGPVAMLDWVSKISIMTHGLHDSAATTDLPINLHSESVVKNHIIILED